MVLFIRRQPGGGNRAPPGLHRKCVSGNMVMPQQSGTGHAQKKNGPRRRHVVAPPPEPATPATAAAQIPPAPPARTARGAGELLRRGYPRTGRLALSGPPVLSAGQSALKPPCFYDALGEPLVDAQRESAKALSGTGIRRQRPDCACDRPAGNDIRGPRKTGELHERRTRL